tara:strand:+ start:2774 stop:4558 length:1785 start_codon:yes stop_codon:yes gene_type:complete
MARAENSITIKFTAKGEKNLELALKKLDVATKRLTGQTSKYEKEVHLVNQRVSANSKGISKLQSSISVYRNKLLLASFATTMFGASIGKLAKLYGEQEAAEKRLQAALGRTSTALLAQASAFQQNSKFGDEEVLNAMALAAAYTDNEKAIKKLSEAALDLSTAKGMDLNTTMDLLTKSVFSSTNAMSRYGIGIEGVVGSTKRLESATDSIAKLYGGRAKDDTETFLGASKQLGNALGDVGENLGSVFIPFLLISAKGMKTFAETFDENRVKSYATALSGAAIAYGVYAVATGKAAKAMVLFNKISKKNIAVLAAMVVIGELIEKINLFSDGTSDLEGEIDKLNGTLGDLNFKQKVTLQQQQALANSAMLLGFATNELNEFEQKEAIQSAKKVQLNELLNAGLITQIEFQTKMNQLTLEDINLEKLRQQAKLSSFSAISGALANLNKNSSGSAKATARLMQIQAGIDAYAAANRALASGVPPFSYIQAAASYAMGAANVVQIEKGIGKFESGGLIGGRRHSQGGTIIEAEQGEFVMSRSAVEAVGIENMNRINQGGGAGITVNVSGNVMTQDFVENDLAEAIKEAARKGADFGIS